MDRIRKLNNIDEKNGECVIYHMSRDHRVNYNHALIEAQNYAVNRNLPLYVVFNLYTKLNLRAYQHFEFMIEGLKEVEEDLSKLNIPLIVYSGEQKESIKKYVEELKPAAIFFDFSPLKNSLKFKRDSAKEIKVQMFEVDTHNIVPVWVASPKEEFGAYTLRPKIKKVLDKYLVEPYKIKKHELNKKTFHKNNWKELLNLIEAKKLENYKPIVKPGYKNAVETLNYFLEEKLDNYSEKKNDPSEKSLSNISAYLHYGQISSLEVALRVKEYQEMNKVNSKSVDSYLEELIVRKELADNYCYYNQNYDNYKGIKPWAQKTLEEHRNDVREFIYTLEEFEFAKTHDDAWNAAQKEMITTGKMHGYMRMYWAKKILEWTESPEKAIEIAIYLNDKYEMDGMDPNGYVGILWSIGGIHDRAWFEREVFGKIRYMNFNGLKRKFDIESYINKFKVTYQ